MTEDNSDAIGQLERFKRALHAWQVAPDDQIRAKWRSIINRDLRSVRELVERAGCHAQYSVTPGGFQAGPIVDIDPFSAIFAAPYGANMVPTVIDQIDQAIGVLQSRAELPETSTADPVVAANPSERLEAPSTGTFAVSGSEGKRKVFLGSTSIDLKDVRAELRQLIPSLGFDLICFEDAGFKKLPGKHRHDMCLDNVPDCDIYVLIIDVSFGDEYSGTDPTLAGKSITWAEVITALENKKSICTFVREEVWNEKSTYTHNLRQGNDITPYFAKDKRVFEFIDYVATQSRDNWIDQFKDSVHLKELVVSRLPQIAA